MSPVGPWGDAAEQVSKKQVLEAEFGVLVQLSFDLHEDPRDVSHHFVLLLKVGRGGRWIAACVADWLPLPPLPFPPL